MLGVSLLVKSDNHMDLVISISANILVGLLFAVALGKTIVYRSWLGMVCTLILCALSLHGVYAWSVVWVVEPENVIWSQMVGMFILACSSPILMYVLVDRDYI